MFSPTSFPSAPPTPSRSSTPAGGVRRSAPVGRGAVAAFSLWAAGGLAGARASALLHLPRPCLPLVIWAPVVLAVLAYRRRADLRDALLAVGIRPLILLHTVRALIGALFLINGARGVLPIAFAVPVGWGDVAIGLLALPIALCAWKPGITPAAAQRFAILAWNGLGFVDILLAFVTAQRQIFFVEDPRMLAALGSWPLALVPLLVVPGVLATHLLVFAHLRRRPRR